MAVIYTIGWIVMIILGYIWLQYAEKENPARDYSSAGFIIVTAAVIWPITLITILLWYLIDKLQK